MDESSLVRDLSLTSRSVLLLSDINLGCCVQELFLLLNSVLVASSPVLPCHNVSVCIRTVI